jgi:hypothetical protein
VLGDEGRELGLGQNVKRGFSRIFAEACEAMNLKEVSRVPDISQIAPSNRPQWTTGDQDPCPRD